MNKNKIVHKNYKLITRATIYLLTQITYKNLKKKQILTIICFPSNYNNFHLKFFFIFTKKKRSNFHGHSTAMHNLCVVYCVHIMETVFFFFVAVAVGKNQYKYNYVHFFLYIQ